MTPSLAFADLDSQLQYGSTTTTPIRSATKRVRVASSSRGRDGSPAAKKTLQDANESPRLTLDKVVPSTPEQARPLAVGSHGGQGQTRTPAVKYSPISILESFNKAAQTVKEGRPGIPRGGHQSANRTPTVSAEKTQTIAIDDAGATYRPLQSPFLRSAQSSPGGPAGEASVINIALRPAASIKPIPENSLDPSSSFVYPPGASDSRGQPVDRSTFPATQGKTPYLNSSPRKSGRRGGHIKNGLAERALNIVKKAQTESRLWAYDLGRSRRETNDLQDSPSWKIPSKQILSAPLSVRLTKTWTGHKIVIAKCHIIDDESDELFDEAKTDGHTTGNLGQTPCSDPFDNNDPAQMFRDSDITRMSRPLSRSDSQGTELVHPSSSLQLALEAAIKLEKSARDRERASTLPNNFVSREGAVGMKSSDQFTGTVIFSFALQPKPPMCSEAEISACYGDICVDIWQPWQEVLHENKTVLLVHHFAVRK